MVSALNSGLRGPGPRGLAHWPRRVNVLCSWTRHYSHCTGRQATASHTLAYGWLPPPIHPRTHNPPPSHFVKFTWIHPSEQIRTGELLACYIIYITWIIWYTIHYICWYRLSKYDGDFVLLLGYPPKKLTNFNEVMKNLNIKGASIVQKKV